MNIVNTVNTMFYLANRANMPYLKLLLHDDAFSEWP